MAINFAILGLGMIAKVMASTILQMNKSGDQTVCGSFPFTRKITKLL